MYASGKYTVTQVTQAYLDRIARYDDVYNAFLYVDTAGALATAAAEDAAKKNAGSRFVPGPLWGVPIAIKGNTRSTARQSAFMPLSSSFYMFALRRTKG